MASRSIVLRISTGPGHNRGPPPCPCPGPPASAAPIGTANPIPANASSSPGSAIDTTMPTTSPWVFSSGPPELPGFTAASNWISPDKEPALIFVLRSRPETIPVVVLSRSPSGLPMATTSEPTATPPPRVAGTTTSGSFFGVSVAMSIFGYEAAIVPDVLVPSANTIEMSPPPETTWWAVSTVPVWVTITPDPSEPFEVVISTTDGTTCRYRSVTGSGVAVATAVGVAVADTPLAEVAEPDPSLNASAAMITMATTRTPAAERAQRQSLPGRTRPPPSVVGDCADPERSACT